MRRTKTEALKTREYLMLAALDTFYQKGVARASLNEIARTAGVTRGALYWHFKNKEDLFDALFQRLCSQVIGRLEEDLNNDATDMWESLHVSLLNMFRRMENDPAHHKFCSVLYLKCERTEQNGAVVSIIGKYDNMLYGLLEAVLARCITQKSLPADLDTAVAVVYLKAAISGLTLQWLANPDRAGLQQNGARFVQAILGSLQTNTALRQPGI